jgi:hypothetical protein
MSARYQKTFTIPEGFPQLLKAFTREVRLPTRSIHPNPASAVRGDPASTREFPIPKTGLPRKPAERSQELC